MGKEKNIWQRKEDSKNMGIKLQDQMEAIRVNWNFKVKRVDMELIPKLKKQFFGLQFEIINRATKEESGYETLVDA